MPVCFQLLLQGAFTGKDKLDYRCMPGLCNCVDQYAVRFFQSEPSGKKDDELICPLLRPFYLCFHKAVIDAVGDHVSVGRAYFFFKHFPNELCGKMNRVHILIDQAIHGLICQIVCQPAVHQVQMIGDVFCLRVETGRYRNMVFPSVFKSGFAKDKRRHDMNDLHVMQRVLKHFAVRYGNGYAVFANILIQRSHVELRHHIISRLSPPLFIRTDHTDIVTTAA